MKESGQIRITSTGTQITPYRKKQNPYLEKLTSVYRIDPRRRFGKAIPVTGHIISDDVNESSFVTHLLKGIFNALICSYNILMCVIIHNKPPFQSFKSP